MLIDIVLSMIAIYLGIGLLFIGGFSYVLFKSYLGLKSKRK